MSSSPERRAVLVTGAGGYIGSLVTHALARRSEEVGPLIATDVVDVPAERRASSAVYETVDVREPKLVELLREHSVDVVVHLAAIVTPKPDDSPDLAYSVDVEGTRNVLDACLAAGAGKLIVTSSGAAYGYHPDNDVLLTEDSPIRGNDAFSYSKHKRLVEEMLADARQQHPELGQLIFRPGTILGPTARNQITALFEKPVVLGLEGFATPFVFISDEDVVGCIVQGVLGDQTGIYNLAGSGVLTLREIAQRLGKRYVALPVRVVQGALGVLERLGVTPYGPEQVMFLQYRPVLSNERLQREFGYRPRYTTREVFERYLESHA